MRIDCCVSYFQKQLIGLLPNQSECLFYYAPDVNIDFWSIDSYTWDEVDALNTFLNPYGIYYNIYTTNNVAEPRFVLSYVGTEPPTYKPTINDPNANPVTWDWTNCCDKVCLEGTFGVDQYALFQSGYFFEALQTFPFDDPYNTTLFKSLYGQQTTYTYTDNGDGTFYIKIDNAFVCNLPLSWSDDNITYTDMVPCGYVPPPAPRCYWFAEYFSAPDNNFDLWTINGNAFDTEIYNITGDASSSLNPLNSVLVYDSRLPWLLTDNPLSLPTIPTALDSLGNPNTPTWQQGGCDLVCWELVVPKTDLQFLILNFGIGIANFLDCPAFYNSPFGLGVQNAGQIAQLQTLYQSMFGSQVTVTSTLDANNDYVVRINNTYEAFAPSWENTTLGQLYFIQVPC